MMKRIALATLALAACTPPQPLTLSPDLAVVDETARSADAQFSGVVLIARGDDILFERTYGLRDAVTQSPLATDTPFNLASAGKMFTAVAILQQVAAGRASLDDPIQRFLPDFPNEALASATLRQLLTHQAGAGDVDFLFGVEDASTRASLSGPASIIARIGDRPPVHAPGGAQQYGNYGHIIMARIVEILSGQDFAEYLEENVFVPAGMRATGFRPCDAMAATGAVGYVPDQPQPTINCRTLPDHGFGAGGQWSTARDMLAFVRALNAGTLLSPALFAEATRTHQQWTGLGFFATDYGKDIPLRDFRWGHGGSADGICADVRHYPRTGETVIVLSNAPAPGCFVVAGTLHAAYASQNDVPRGQ